VIGQFSKKKEGWEFEEKINIFENLIKKINQ